MKKVLIMSLLLHFQKLYKNAHKWCLKFPSQESFSIITKSILPGVFNRFELTEKVVTINLKRDLERISYYMQNNVKFILYKDPVVWRDYVVNAAQHGLT